jgi:hypothetical protein
MHLEDRREGALALEVSIAVQVMLSLLVIVVVISELWLMMLLEMVRLFVLFVGLEYLRLFGIHFVLNN